MHHVMESDAQADLTGMTCVIIWIGFGREWLDGVFCFFSSNVTKIAFVTERNGRELGMDLWWDACLDQRGSWMVRRRRVMWLVCQPGAPSRSASAFLALLENLMANDSSSSQLLQRTEDSWKLLNWPKLRLNPCVYQIIVALNIISYCFLVPYETLLAPWLPLFSWHMSYLLIIWFYVTCSQGKRKSKNIQNKQSFEDDMIISPTFIPKL